MTLVEAGIWLGRWKRINRLRWNTSFLMRRYRVDGWQR